MNNKTDIQLIEECQNYIDATQMFIPDEYVELLTRFKAMRLAREQDKNNLIEHMENCLSQPISQAGNVDFQKGYRQSISDSIHIIKAFTPI